VSARRQTLSFTYVEGALWAIMVATAESYALYFAILRGLTSTEVAVLTTVPILLGALMNWLMPFLITTRYLKLGVLTCIFLQVMGLGALVLSVDSEHYGIVTFIGLSLYWMGGMGATPLWMDWVAGWLPRDKFGRFYTRRSSILSFVTAVFFVAAGYLIYRSPTLNIFYFIFGLAFLARFISFGFLMAQESPPWKPKQLLAEIDKNPRVWSWTTIWTVIIFAALFKLVANIGSPFFLPYMMNELQLDAVQIALVNGMSFLGLGLFVASFGEALISFRAVTGLQIAMVLAALNCLLWTFFTNIFAIATLQLFSGINWTIFDFACVLIIQSNFPNGARRVLGIQMALASLATILGSLVGSWLLNSGASSIEVFEISAFLRFFVAFCFLGYFYRSSELRIPLKTYRDFLKTAFSIRLGIFKT